MNRDNLVKKMNGVFKDIMEYLKETEKISFTSLANSELVEFYQETPSNKGVVFFRYSFNTPIFSLVSEEDLNSALNVAVRNKYLTYVWHAYLHCSGEPQKIERIDLCLNYESISVYLDELRDLVLKNLKITPSLNTNASENAKTYVHSNKSDIYKLNTDYNQMVDIEEYYHYNDEYQKEGNLLVYHNKKGNSTVSIERAINGYAITWQSSNTNTNNTKPTVSKSKKTSEFSNN